MPSNTTQTGSSKDKAASKDANAPSPNQGFFKAYRREIVFILLFVTIVGGGFTLIAWKPVNDHVIEPFTSLVAKASGLALSAIGQGTKMTGTIIRNDKFAVNIRNGCNGVETMIIFLAAVLAFPAPWKARFWGLALGVLAIQAVNLLRVVALFLTGAYFPDFFDSSHTVVWQTIVIAFGVLLWIFWANRYALPPTSGDDAREATAS